MVSPAVVAAPAPIVEYFSPVSVVSYAVWVGTAFQKSFGDLTLVTHFRCSTARDRSPSSALLETVAVWCWHETRRFPGCLASASGWLSCSRAIRSSSVVWLTSGVTQHRPLLHLRLVLKCHVTGFPEVLPQFQVFSELPCCTLHQLLVMPHLRCDWSTCS